MTTKPSPQRRRGHAKNHEVPLSDSSKDKDGSAVVKILITEND
jgi:hypothetical protein